MKKHFLKLVFRILLLGLPIAIVCTGCRPDSTSHEGHIHDHEAAPHAGHHHDPPHGGTPIRLGDEQYHLEWVKDEALGVMRCYVLDGHMEQFIRIAQTSFVVEVSAPDDTKIEWTFQAVENRATGETIGNTSEFHAPLEPLPDQNSFEGIIREVHISGNDFEKVAVRFPEGNEG